MFFSLICYPIKITHLSEIHHTAMDLEEASLFLGAETEFQKTAISMEVGETIIINSPSYTSRLTRIA